MMSMKKTLAKIFRGLIVMLSKLPLKFHYFMGDILSWVAKNVIHYRSKVVMINLSRSFPEKKYHEIRAIYNDFYRHFAELVAETIWFGGSSYDRLRRHGIVKIVNPEVVSQLYDSSPSLTILSTHCGNWELLGGFLGYRTQTGEKVDLEEEQITVVYKQLTSKFSDEFFKRNRAAALEKVGTSCEIESSNILRYAIKHRKDKTHTVIVHAVCRSSRGGEGCR